MITQPQIDQFVSDGYLVIDLNVKNDLLDNIVRDTTAGYPEQQNNKYHHGTRLQDFWKQSESVRELALNQQIIKVLRLLYHRKPLPFQTLNFPIGTQQPLHSDTLHFNSFPNNFMCGAWVALEDIDEENGPICYCPGSQKLPEYNMQDVGKGITHDNYKHYEAFIQNLVAEKNYQPVLATLNKGQALIWHGNLLHGGSPQKDKNRTRHSQVTHYYFEGCQYYTPMLSTPDNIHLRTPEWIEAQGINAVTGKFKSWLAGIFRH